MDKAKIAEYIALMLMELVINAENTNLRKEVKNMYKGAVDSNTVMIRPEYQEKGDCRTRAKARARISFLETRAAAASPSVPRASSRSRSTTRTISPRPSGKASMTKKNADLKKKSLIDFYKETPDGEEDTNLGMYYLSYLSEACEKVNVKFESMANQFRDSDLTVINLSFFF